MILGHSDPDHVLLNVLAEMDACQLPSVIPAGATHSTSRYSCSDGLERGNRENRQCGAIDGFRRDGGPIVLCAC